MLDDDDVEDARLNALVISLVTLSEELEKAFDSESNRKDVEDERARYIQGLYAISNFLQANNAPIRYARRWNRLAVALNDLNNGRSDPLLLATSFGGGNLGDLDIEWIAKANVALGTTALVAGEHLETRPAKWRHKKSAVTLRRVRV